MLRYRHEIANAWIWVTARNGRLGEIREVLSRREMQAADSTLRTELLLNTPWATFAGHPHGSDVDSRVAYPDVGLVAPTRGWSTVILTPPPLARLHALLERYHHNRLVHSQLYLVEQDQNIDSAITNAAQVQRPPLPAHRGSRRLSLHRLT